MKGTRLFNLILLSLNNHMHYHHLQELLLPNKLKIKPINVGNQITSCSFARRGNKLLGVNFIRLVKYKFGRIWLHNIILYIIIYSGCLRINEVLPLF